MSKDKKKAPNTTPTIQNRKAGFEYEFLEKLDAGIMLTGTEIKSVREAKVQMGDAYCIFLKGELYVRNMTISEFGQASQFFNHKPGRERKLLLTRKELNRLLAKVKEKGYTIVPIKLYFNDRNLCKLQIALARGKKAYDKRESVKEKDQKRDMERGLA